MLRSRQVAEDCRTTDDLRSKVSTGDNGGVRKEQVAAMLLPMRKSHSSHRTEEKSLRPTRLK